MLLIFLTLFSIHVRLSAIVFVLILLSISILFLICIVRIIVAVPYLSVAV